MELLQKQVYNAKKQLQVKESLFILKDSVYHILLQDEIFAIKIESKEHAKMMEILFDRLWEVAKDPHEKKKKGNTSNLH